jgi:NAD(P)-dependent dehydrogenase (short-subunit alcohol dehydrogenase family)
MSTNGVLVVTGGSRGIGAATAILGAARGYAVVVNYAGNVEAAEQVCHEIRLKGGTAVAVRGDVADEAEVEHIFAAADRLGTLTGLVNNAGILGPTASLKDLDAERINRILAVNVTGSMLCAKAAVARMSTKNGGKGGAIVNLSSAASKLGSAHTFLDYAASKGAIDTFTVGLALEVADAGIRVNAVRPGIIETDIHASGGDPDRAQRLGPTVPMQRSGSAEEVAAAIIWLLSDDASYTTGTTISIAGGRGISP